MGIPDDMRDDDGQKSDHEVMMGMIETWPAILDTIDGMLAQTLQRGWPEPMARAIVASAFGFKNEG